MLRDGSSSNMLASAGMVPTNMLGAAVPGRLAMGLPPSLPMQLGKTVGAPSRDLRVTRGPRPPRALGNSGTISLASLRSLQSSSSEPPGRFSNTPVRGRSHVLNLAFAQHMAGGTLATHIRPPNCSGNACRRSHRQCWVVASAYQRPTRHWSPCPWVSAPRRCARG